MGSEINKLLENEKIINPTENILPVFTINLPRPRTLFLDA